MWDASKHPRNRGRFSTTEGLGVAAVGVPGAVVANRYATGALALRKLNQGAKAAGQLRKIGHSVSHVRGPLPDQPRKWANGLASQHISRTQNKLSPNPLRRKLVQGASEWEYYRGMNRVRAIHQGPGLRDKLSPNYAKRKVFLEAVKNAPASKRELHRGIAVDAKTFETGFKPGTRMGGRPESWTDSAYKAERHSTSMTKDEIQRRAGSHIPGTNKQHPVMLHLEAGHPALNIQGLGKMGQGEWVSAHPYEVVRREGQHVYVRTVKKNISKMSEAEISRRKHLQGQISRTTATLGLAALGSRLAAPAAPKLARLAKVPIQGNKARKKLVGASGTLTTLGAGIGGAGGYNFAAYTNAEAKRRQQTPVKKHVTDQYEYHLQRCPKMDLAKADTQDSTNRRLSMDFLDFGLSGVKQGYPIEQHPLDDEVSKGQYGKGKFEGGDINELRNGTYKQFSTPLDSKAVPSYVRKRKNVTKAYDPEANRDRRLSHYSIGAAMAGGAAGAGAVHQANKARKGLKATTLPAYKAGVKAGGKGAALAAVAAGGAMASERIHRYRQSSGRPYRALPTPASY